MMRVLTCLGLQCLLVGPSARWGPWELPPWEDFGSLLTASRDPRVDEPQGVHQTVTPSSPSPSIIHLDRPSVPPSLQHRERELQARDTGTGVLHAGMA